jgi:cyclopropane-fatty-acyl-phospholipid synthase
MTETAHMERNGSNRVHSDELRIITRENIDTVRAGLPKRVGTVLSFLTRMRHGALTITFPTGERFRFESGNPGPDADITLHNWNPPRRAILGGSIGIAESYMDGEWDSENVTDFLELFSVNHEVGNALTTPPFLITILERFRHWMNANTKRGSRKNISAHYDLGNEFYSLWLDKSMTYSSAIYDETTNSLDAAQERKYRSLVERADIRHDHSVLEIGCGWGGFAEYVAKHVGARVTGLTISREQLEFAQERIFREGLNDRVELKFQDYRDETGTYDRIASIEMFEAVGEKYWQPYYQKLRDCLKTGGRAGLQIITICDRSFDIYRSRPDFIQKYVFPGGMLPSPTTLSELAEIAGFTEDAPKIFGHDYARTLAEWRQRFRDKWGEIKALGFDERFRRMWEFYLHYCEAGFRSENIDVRQVFYQKA